jgi:hypothetical protein
MVAIERAAGVEPARFHSMERPTIDGVMAGHSRSKNGVASLAYVSRPSTSSL